LAVLAAQDGGGLTGAHGEGAVGRVRHDRPATVPSLLVEDTRGALAQLLEDLLAVGAVVGRTAAPGTLPGGPQGPALLGGAAALRDSGGGGGEDLGAVRGEDQEPAEAA